MKINFKDIKVSNGFLKTVPRQSKLDIAKESFNNGSFNKSITINAQGYLIDGYSLWYVLNKEGYSGEIEVKTKGDYKPRYTRYVATVFDNNDKRYYWKVPETFNKKSLVGKRVLVRTFNGSTSVTVVRDFVDMFKPVSGKMQYILKIIE